VRSLTTAEAWDAVQAGAALLDLRTNVERRRQG
jgi:hypothetical protein